MSSPAPHAADSAPAIPPRLCRNCAHPLRGPFCSACGQQDIDYHRSFHHLLHDLLESLFHFEGKTPVTIAWLLAHPGRLTTEFIAGRRQSQLHPLRFYIFVSVLFFLGVSLLNHGHLIDFNTHRADQLRETIATQLAEADRYSLHFTEAEKEEFARRMALATGSGEVDLAKLNETLQLAKEVAAQRAAEKASTPAASPPRAAEPPNVFQTFFRRLTSGELSLRELADAVERRIPSLIFLGVPLFALLLKLLYVRSGRYYIEHLVFSLHLHTWAFLALMVGNGYLKLASLGPLWIATAVGWILLGWVAWYVLLAFRRVYAQGWPKTALKITLLTVVHGFLLLFVALLLIAATMFWLALA